MSTRRGESPKRTTEVLGPSKAIRATSAGVSPVAANPARVLELLRIIADRDLLRFARTLAGWGQVETSSLLTAPLSPASLAELGGLLAPGSTLLHYLVLLGDERFCREALLYVHDVNTVEDASGETPLTLAFVEPRAQPLVPLLLQAAMSSEQTSRQLKRINSKGRSLLHAAVTSAKSAATTVWPERYATVQFLVDEAGISPSIRDARSMTPASWARVQHLGSDGSKIIAFLEERSGAIGGGRGSIITAGDIDAPHTFWTIIKHPWVRIFSVLVLMLLHCLQYCVDLADRIRDDTGTSFPKANFPFVFVVINLFSTKWDNINSSGILATKIGCIVIGLLLGVAFNLLLVRYLLLQLALRAKVVGSGTAKIKWRGAFFFIVTGAYCGVFAGGKLYNYFLQRYHTERYDDLYVSDVFSGSTNVAAMRTYWIAQLLLDLYVMILVVDTMIQQSTRHISLPHPSFSLFLSAWQSSLRAFRMIWFWLVYPLGAACILLPMLSLEIRGSSNSTVEQAFGNPFITTSHDAQAVVVPSCSILLIAICFAQDWALPNCQKRRLMAAPGIPSFAITCNTTWWLWLVLMTDLALDVRLFGSSIQHYMANNDVNNGSDTLRGLLFLAVFPAAVGVWIIFMVLVLSSEWCSSSPNEEDDETLDEALVMEGRGLGLTRQSSSLGGTSEAAPSQRKAEILHQSRDGGEMTELRTQQQSANPRAALSPDRPRSQAAMSTLEWMASSKRRVHPASETHTDFATITPTPHRSQSPVRVVQSLSALEAPAPPVAPHTAATDIWTAAFTNNVGALREMIAKDPDLVNARGGSGLVCNPQAKRAFLNTDQLQQDACAASPIHYAVASNSRAAITFLLSKGANPKLRTSSGLFNAKELAAMCGHSGM